MSKAVKKAGVAVVAKKSIQTPKKVDPKKSLIKSESKTLVETVPATTAVKPGPSQEELEKHKSATRIQCVWRRFKAKQLLAKLRQEKRELDETIQRLEQQAFLQMIKLEQEREYKKRMKQLKEKQMQQKRAARRKKFIEAAYDANLQDMKYLIADLEKEIDMLNNDDEQEVKLDAAKQKQAKHALIDCRDSNGNSALSEAAAGGGPDVVRFLLEHNADVNSKGNFGRTPLWRAAFSGHLNCVQILLENGADPRLYSDDGQRPADCATQSSLIDLLKNWNIQLTDREIYYTLIS